MPRVKLTSDQEEYIRLNYLLMSSQDIANSILVGESVVARYKSKNDLKVPKEISRSFAVAKALKRTSCTPMDDIYIKEAFLSVTPQKIADHLGCSEQKIKTRMRQLGLEIPREIIDQRIKDSRIKKGDVPPNAGKRQIDYMSPEAIERTKGTRFKKGGIPKNAYNEVGKITERYEHPDRNGGKRYKYICLSLGIWVPLHKHIWEAANGKIPKSHCLWFKDGDSLNVTIENLELITRAENMNRNSAAVNLPDKAIATYLSKNGHQTDQELRSVIMQQPDLIKAKRTELLLNRKLKTIENGKK